MRKEDWKDVSRVEGLIVTLSRWRSQSKLSTYCIIQKSQVIATIAFKRHDNSLTVIAQSYKDFKRSWFSKTVRGSGYDRETAALDGFVAGTVTVKDGSHRWENAFNAAGCEVHQTL